jgi:thioredoxin-like negative regulator of GroEL
MLYSIQVRSFYLNGLLLFSYGVKRCCMSSFFKSPNDNDEVRKLLSKISSEAKAPLEKMIAIRPGEENQGALNAINACSEAIKENANKETVIMGAAKDVAATTSEESLAPTLRR